MNNILTEFTFMDTGKSVKIRKVSPMLDADIDASIPEPIPPLNKVDYGDGPVEEPNYSDEGYQRAIQKRNGTVGMAVLRAKILRGVVVEGDDWKTEVEEYRQFIQDTTGKPLEEKSDLVVYVMRICSGTQDDLTDLMMAISKRSQPTQEEIERAKTSFRNKV